MERVLVKGAGPGSCKGRTGPARGEGQGVLQTCLGHVHQATCGKGSQGAAGAAWNMPRCSRPVLWVSPTDTPCARGGLMQMCHPITHDGTLTSATHEHRVRKRCLSTRAPKLIPGTPQGHASQMPACQQLQPCPTRNAAA
jgi:hypothetical protein